MKRINIGICGLGTVACGTLNVLTRNHAEITARAGCDINVAMIGARRDNPACDTSKFTVVRDIQQVVDNPEIDILVELIGGTTVARELVLRAIDNGKHVVTANKALIAHHGDEIFARAQEKGVTVGFEAAVAGGIPIIKAIREGLAGNRIEWIAGIINGTSNFILTEMQNKGRKFSDVLKDAQKRGFAEADPTFDVEGIDAAHKLAILAAIAYGIPLQIDKVYTEGVSNIELADLQYADSLGYRIKHLGIAKRVEGVEQGIELRVHPALIPKKRLIANVAGVMNAIVVKGDAVGPTLYYGAGAGDEPTASAVIADLVDLARNLAEDSDHCVPHLGFYPDQLQDVPVLPIGEVETAYYLRMLVKDEPGVLSRISSILSESGISIEAIQQPEAEEEQKNVSVIILTSKASESRLDKAVAAIQELKTTAGKIKRIRIETLD